MTTGTRIHQSLEITIDVEWNSKMRPGRGSRASCPANKVQSGLHDLRMEGGLIESSSRHHRDGHHVRLILHYNSLYSPRNVRVHVPDPASSIYDDDVQSFWLLNYNHELCLRFRTVFVRDVHRPTVHIHDEHEWPIGNDITIYADVLSVVLWSILFIIIHTPD